MFGDGAAYNPQTETWRQLAAAPIDARWGHDAFWDGDEVVIVGGVGVTDGAAYDPATDRWRTLEAETPFEGVGWNVISASTEDELIVWEGRSGRMWSYSSTDDEWAELPQLPMTINAGRVVHVGDQLVATGLPMPTEDQQVRTAVLAADRAEWRLVEELDGSMIGELDVAVLQGDAGNSVMMWGSASADAAWQLSSDFVWESTAGPGLTPCDGAPEIVQAGDQLIVRSLCDDGAVMRPRTTGGTWTPIDFDNDSDPAPVWTGSALVGLGFGGEIYTWSP